MKPVEVVNNKPVEQPAKNRLWIWIVLILLVVVIVAVLLWRFVFRRVDEPTATTTATTPASPSSTVASTGSWQEKGVAVAGQYADADIVDLGNGQYRLYYAVEPEVSGNNLEVFSSVSSDGVNWTKENGKRKDMAVFPDVLKLPDGRWRMYYQNSQVIKSAISTDGLKFTDEPGTRIDAKESGFNLESVGAQSTTILPDGSYVMLYRGTINQPYQTTDKLPNQNTQLYFWATSKDGLTFERQGVAIDSRNETLLGLADGADFVKWDNNELRVYFWSYTGIYHTVFADGKFSALVFDFSNNKDSKMKFAPNPPSDPTTAKINNVWYLYYGQHTKGIYYATAAK